MALIKCSECGKEISENAKNCPNCGSPVSAPSSNGQNGQKEKASSLSTAAFILSIIGCTFIIGAVLAIIDLTHKDGKKKILSIAALIICGVWLIIGIAVSGSRSDDKKDTPQATEASIEKNDSDEVASEPQEEKEPEIEYISVTATQLSDELSNNAMKAQNDYKGQYLEITGKLGNIDSSGKYIDIDSDNDFDLTIIQCYFKTDEQKEIIMNKVRGDTIKVKGYCKNVGEIMGYSIDINSVE